jgi:hypothetical protein
MQAKYFSWEKGLIISPLKRRKQPFARLQLHVIHEVGTSKNLEIAVIPANNHKGCAGLESSPL